MLTRDVESTKAQANRAGRGLVAWSVLAGLLLLAVLAGPFFAGRIYTADDLGAFHFPVRVFYAQQLAKGGPYDWMPGLFSGFYLTGEGQGGVYHPLHQLLYRLLPLRAALGWEYLMSYPLMMLGTWRLLGRWLGSGAAMFGALLFTFSSFNVLHFVHPNAVAIVAHIPWLLWAIDIVLTDSRPRKVALAAVAIALLTGSQLLLGYPQYVWFSLLAEFCYAVFLVMTRKYAARIGCRTHATCDDCVGCTTATWPRLIIAKEIGVLLGGVQLLPTLDAWLNSARMSADNNFAVWGSLHPLNLLQLVAPYLFVDRVVGGNTHEFGLYLGAVPLLLVVWVVARRCELGRMAPLAWATFGFALFVLLLSLGQYGGLYSLVSWLPPFQTFRFPARYVVLFELATAVLAAIGFGLLMGQCGRARQQRRHNDLPKERRNWLALWREFEPLWCVVAISATVAAMGVAFQHEPYIASLPAILIGPALMLVAAALIVVAAYGYRWALVGLILLAALDQGCYGLSRRVYAESAALDKYVASAVTPPGAPEGRVVASLLGFDQPGLRTGNLMTAAGWRRADGYAGLEPHRQLDYRLLPALRVAGVRWVQDGPSTAGIAGLKRHDDRWLEVPKPLPRVRLVTQTKTSHEPDIDIARIRPDTVALCEVPIVLPTSKPGTAVLKADRPGRLEIDVETPAVQLLVVAESFHSGWRAEVDGNSQEVYRINGDFMGCLMERGKHQVILSFQPASLERGWLTSCIGLSLVSLCFLGFTSRPRPNTLEDDLL